MSAKLKAALTAALAAASSKPARKLETALIVLIFGAAAKVLGIKV